MSEATHRLSKARNNLRGVHGGLAAAVFDTIAPSLLSPVEARDPKRFNDPIWGTIELRPQEVALLDTLLMQRLRRIRQLGLAYLVYPSAHHTRFEHSLGALEATERMFTRLAKSAQVMADCEDRLRKRARIAALLHDCGHCCFSHVTDRVLDFLYKEVFESLGNVLHGLFPDDVTQTSCPGARRALPAPAEVLSVLLVLSPALGEYLHKLQFSDDDIVCIAGLILGRAYQLLDDSKTRDYFFVKSLISGDLDADKVDYVARDAYFAGIPIAGDVGRLISQLEAVRLAPGLIGKATSSVERYVLGVKPAGVAAVEMFVLTRSYIFDRIYCHANIRAAERGLERALCAYLKTLSAPCHVLEEIMLRGDDQMLAHFQDNPEFRRFSERRLLERALAVSRRAVYGYDSEGGHSLASVTQIWSRKEDTMYERGEEVEQLIRDVAGLGADVPIILDTTQRNPIKEDPDIWVCPRGRPPEKVNRHFDVEKYANAYQDIKETTWVFTTREHRSAIAAATTLCLAATFGLIPSDDAYVKAKLEPEDVTQELRKLRNKAEGESDDDRRRSCLDRCRCFPR